MTFFNLKDGTKIFYKEEGSGAPPLVLLHGWSMNSFVWQNQITYLSKYYRVITPDLKGHGASDKPQARYTVREFLDESNQLFDKLLSKERFVLCGHSMGGFISLSYATDPTLSRKLKALILCHTTYALKGNPGMKGLGEALKKGLLGSRQQAAENINRTGFNSKFINEHKDFFQKFVQETLKCPEHVLTNCVESWVAEYDCTDKLAQINIPVLIISSDTDGQMDPKNSQYMKDHIKNSQLVVIKPKIGHHSMIESPGEFNKAVKGFIDKL
ncbi:MAG: alpha/beta hydrolase [Candidatus Atabeyarchaeum deiterrae]